MPSGAVAAIAGGASIASGIMGSSAASKAGRYQRQAAQIAAETQLKMYEQGRKDIAPWREAGARALGTLEEMIAAGPGEFTEDPGYRFRLSEGEKAINRLAAARGGYFGGATGKALTRYGQEYATGEYQNFLNRYYQRLAPYQSLAGVGQTSAGLTAQLGQQAGGRIGEYQMAAGQARAGGAINQANVYQNMLSQTLQPYLLWQMGAFGGGQNPQMYGWGGSPAIPG